jgi:hypothetical protein
MSILTCISNGQGHYELLNDKGTAIAQLSEEMKDRLIHEGVIENIFTQKDSP